MNAALDGIASADRDATRTNNQDSGRPSPPHIVGEFQTVHSPPQFDIGENGPYLRLPFEKVNGLFRRVGLVNLETGILKRHHDIQPYERLIFYDEHDPVEAGVSHLNSACSRFF
jgi:hypothetical protein